LRRLDELGILTQIHPALRCDNWFVRKAEFLRKHLEQWAEGNWSSSLQNSEGESAAVHSVHMPEQSRDVSLIYLGLFTFRMIGEELETLIVRLNLAKDDADRLREVDSLRSLTPTLSRAQRPSVLCTLLHPYSSLALFVYWVTTDSETVRGQIELYMRELRYVRPEIDGQYLKDVLHIPAGPIYSRLLKAVRDARLDGQVASLAEEEEFVRQLYFQERDNKPDRA